MKNKGKINKLKRQIKKQFDELSTIQDQLLNPKEMIQASLIKRHLGTKKAKRSSYAFYLSTTKKGHTRLQYVSKNKFDTTNTKVMEWKKYKKNIRDWRTLTEKILYNFKELGKIQNQIK